MRILWDNKIDGSAVTITSSTEATNFDDDNVQDDRLAVTWRATAAASEWIEFNAGGALKSIFGTAVNLITDPEDLTTGNWTETGVAASAAGLSAVGYDLNKITVSTAAGTIYQAPTFTGDAVKAIQVLFQRGTSDTSIFRLRDSDASATRAEVEVDWGNNTVSATAGVLVVERWFDDDTVLLALATDSVTAANENRVTIAIEGTASDYMYATAVQAEDDVHPNNYTSSTADATVVSHTFQLPPSGKFVVDTILRPWFTYTTSSQSNIWSWRNDSTHILRCYYDPTGDDVRVAWQDGGGVTTLLDTSAFDDGTSLTNLYQRIRVIASIDVSEESSSGSRLIVVPLESGSALEDTSWSATADGLSSTFATLQQGANASTGIANSEFEYLRVYAGTLVGTVSTDSDATTLIDALDNLFDQTDQTKFTVDAAGITGHNFTAGAVVNVEGNNWDIWSYSQDGAIATDLTRNTMTWREDLILAFITSQQKQYWRFTIVDPNNSDTYVEIGRCFLGEYLQVTPSSYIEFPLTLDTTDRFSYSQGRQLYGDVGVQYKRLSYQFPGTDDSQKKLMEAMWVDRGMVKPIWFMNYDTAYSRVPPVYMHIAEPMIFRSVPVDHWEYDLSLVEVK